MGETEYQFGFGNANDPMRGQSPVLEISYSNINPQTDPSKHSMASGYLFPCTCNLTTLARILCPIPLPISTEAAGCSLLQYTTEEPEWKSFECTSRRFNLAHGASEWRQEEENQHLFINLEDLEDDPSLRHSKDLNVCGPACRDAGYPLMEMGCVRNSESPQVLSRHGARGRAHVEQLRLQR